MQVLVADARTLSRFGPPQNSELFPAQAMLQSESGVGAPPFRNSVSQTAFERRIHQWIDVCKYAVQTYSIESRTPCLLEDSCC